MRLQFRLLVVLALLATTLGTLAGCGSSGSDDRSATEILAKTFSSDASVKSGRLTLALDADVRGVQGVDGPVALKLEGPFQSAGEGRLPKFAFTLAIRTGGQTITAGAVSTSDKGWLSFQGRAFSVPDALFAQFRDAYVQSQREDAQADEAKDGAHTLRALGIDPRTWLTDPKKGEPTTIGDAEVDHVTSGIDVARLVADVQKSLERAGRPLTEAQRSQLVGSVRSAKVDVYSGREDDRLRKLVVDVALESGRLAFTLQIDQLDEEQRIEAPRDARPLSELTGSLSDPGAAGGANNAAYLRCRAAAGQDLAKAQACARFL